MRCRQVEEDEEGSEVEVEEEGVKIEGEVTGPKERVKKIVI